MQSLLKIKNEKRRVGDLSFSCVSDIINTVHKWKRNKIMKKFQIPILVIIACVIMAIIDAIIQPGYMIKSLIKIIVFLLIPTVYAWWGRDIDLKKLIKPHKKGIFIALMLGVAVYCVVLGAYFIFRNVFDFSALTKSLGETTGVTKSNFLYVSIYISFVNSLLEEFFFRGFSFITLKKETSRGFAYIFSSSSFALYHIAMMIGWFSFPVILLSLIGLFAGGLIFNRFDEKNENIYLSWLLHMFANFATNTIGFILFAM